MFSVCCHPEIFYHGNMTQHFLLTTNTVIYHNWLNLHWPNNTFSNGLIHWTFDGRTNWLFNGCLLWNGRPRKRVIYLCLTHQKPHDTVWKTDQFHLPKICPLFLPQTKLPWWDLSHLSFRLSEKQNVETSKNSSWITPSGVWYSVHQKRKWQKNKAKKYMNNNE